MSEGGSLIYIDHSEVREGRLEQLKEAVSELAELVKTNEPRIIAYNAYFSEDNRRISIIHIHHDSASLELHGKVAGPALANFVDLVKLLTIEVYGQPSDTVLEQLRNKARLLGNAALTVHKWQTGFSRL